MERRLKIWYTRVVRVSTLRVCFGVLDGTTEWLVRIGRSIGGMH